MKLSTRVGHWFFLGLIGLGVCADAPLRAGELNVSIVKPKGRVPLFGPVDVVAEITGDVEVRGVEVHLDGELAAVRWNPPWTTTIDVGQENAERLIEVVAWGIDGTEARARVVAPPIVVHDRVELDLQQLYVTVQDGKRRVLDLPSSVFEVRDEGNLQEIVTFEDGDAPFTAVLLLDGSISMEGQRFTTAREGAAAFLRGTKELDEARVLVFHNRLAMATPFALEAETLLPRLKVSETGEGTRVHDHLFLALQLLEERQGRRVVVLLSDGVDFDSVVELQDLEALARRSPAAVYWVRLDGPHKVRQSNIAPSAWASQRHNFREMKRLERLVESTGGRVAKLRGVDEIVPAFEDILRELREQYVVGYYPDPRHRDGRWRKVDVTVDVPGVRVRTREGYVDRKPSPED